jgi:hypothetical protein
VVSFLVVLVVLFLSLFHQVVLVGHDLWGDQAHLYHVVDREDHDLWGDLVDPFLSVRQAAHALLVPLVVHALLVPLVVHDLEVHHELAVFLCRPVLLSLVDHVVVRDQALPVVADHVVVHDLALREAVLFLPCQPFHGLVVL